MMLIFCLQLVGNNSIICQWNHIVISCFEKYVVHFANILPAILPLRNRKYILDKLTLFWNNSGPSNINLNSIDILRLFGASNFTVENFLWNINQIPSRVWSFILLDLPWFSTVTRVKKKKPCLYLLEERPPSRGKVSVEEMSQRWERWQKEKE